MNGYTNVDSHLNYMLLLNTSTSGTTSEVTKADTGLPTTYIKPTYRIYPSYCQQFTNGLHNTLPNSTKIQGLNHGRLTLHHMLQPTALLYLQLNNRSIISIGKIM